MYQVSQLFKQNNDKYLYLKYLLFAITIYFPILYNLNNLYIMIWDEARVACSSYEMLKNGNYFAVTFFDKLDDWSTKPILLNWIQILFIKIFSFSELSVRLPSALAGFTTCLYLLLFLKKRAHVLSIGFITVLVLVTSVGYTYFDHSVRTADYEGVLSAFMIIGSLQFFIYVFEKNDKAIFYGIILYAIAALIKGPAGLFFIPSVFVYLLVKKQLLRTFKNKYFYFGVFAYVILIISVYALREKYHPGYLKLFNEMEFLGRQNKVIEGHTGGFWFYLDAFVNLRFDNWYGLVPIGIILGLWIIHDDFIKNLSLFFLILFLGFFLIISSSQTKCNWYDFSLFPIISYFAALPIWSVYSFIVSNDKIFYPNYNKYFGYIFIIILFFNPYKRAYNNAVQPSMEEGFVRYNTPQNYLKFKRPVIKNAIIAVDSYFSPQLFYVYKHKDYNLKIENYKRQYLPGERVIAAESHVNEFIEKEYNVAVLDSFEFLRVYKILSKK